MTNPAEEVKPRGLEHLRLSQHPRNKAWLVQNGLRVATVKAGATMASQIVTVWNDSLTRPAPVSAELVEAAMWKALALAHEVWQDSYQENEVGDPDLWDAVEDERKKLKTEIEAHLESLAAHPSATPTEKEK